VALTLLVAVATPARAGGPAGVAAWADPGAVPAVAPADTAAPAPAAPPTAPDSAAAPTPAAPAAPGPAAPAASRSAALRDSAGAVADSGEAEAARRALEARRAALRAAQAKVPFLRWPSAIMWRSLLVPGWGQLANGAWLKAIGFAAGEGLLIGRLVRDARALDDLDREILEARGSGDIEREDALIERYNARLDASVGRQWLLAGLVAYAMLDAYVDAHFRSFEIEFDDDPARSGGPAGASVRLTFRWGS
jgi:hypothetical protein